MNYTGLRGLLRCVIRSIAIGFLSQHLEYVVKLRRVIIFHFSFTCAPMRGLYPIINYWLLPGVRITRHYSFLLF